MKVELQKQHQWLHKLVGDWTYETDAHGETGNLPQKATGTEKVRSLGGAWVIAEGEGEMGGGPASSVMTLGYDPDRKSFVGTWICSVMTNLWVYDGELDAGEKSLTLHSEGPSMAGDGTKSKYKDIIEFKSDDHRLLRSEVQNADGSWQQFMVVNYRRKR